ncbi:MAG: hypothetical protein R2856_23555 [Caldilineaceae bacterium]
MTVDDTLSKIEAHVKRHVSEVEFIRQNGMEPSKTPLESPFTEPLRRAVTAAMVRSRCLFLRWGQPARLRMDEDFGVHSFGTPYANHDEANHAQREPRSRAFHQGDQDRRRCWRCWDWGLGTGLDERKCVLTHFRSSQSPVC